MNCESLSFQVEGSWLLSFATGLFTPIILLHLSRCHAKPRLSREFRAETRKPRRIKW